MNLRMGFRHWTFRIVSCFTLLFAFSGGAADLSIATYNVLNYIDHQATGRELKSPESKAKIRESIKALKADVIALQEMGRESALLELRTSLKAEGLPSEEFLRLKREDVEIEEAKFARRLC